MAMIYRILILILALLFESAAQADSRATIDVSYVLGDTASPSVIEAVRRLRADPALAGAQFHVFSGIGPGAREQSARDPEVLKRSKIVFVQTMGLDLAQFVSPEIPQIGRSGGTAFSVGPEWDERFAALGLAHDDGLAAYFSAGGAKNIEAMTRVALDKVAGLKTEAPAPIVLPQSGALELSTGAVHATFEAYRDAYPGFRAGAPWVGLAFYRNSVVSGQMEVVSALAAALERRGLNVIPFYGYPDERGIKTFGFDAAGKPTLAALAGISMKFGVKPETTVELLKKLDAPAVNLITLNTRTRDQWETSKVGLEMMERSWQISYAELGGLIAPTVIASKEPYMDAETGLKAVKDTPIPERIERAAERLARLIALRTTPAKEKRIAALYYNFPPGKENIGASYLNVMPKSLWTILQRLKAEGYDTTGAPESEEALASAILDRGGNINSWSTGTLEERVRKGLADGSVSLLPVKTYKEWLASHIPEKTRKEMIAEWGEPDSSKIMTWRDEKGEAFFVFPTLRFGNVIFSPEPTRGWDQDMEKLYHNTTLAPHHQYMAYYLWLQKVADVHAVMHVGTHATYEWHAGKEVGFTEADPSELFVGAVPQVYPYIVDDIGEGMQAKRRGMAAIVSHMTPPLDKASLHPQLRELKQLLSDYKVALDKSPEVAAAVRAQTQQRCEAQGIMKDLGVEKLASDEDMEALEHYLEEIGDKTTPFGLHTFGVAPEPRYRETTAEAILAVDAKLSPEERLKRTKDYVAAIELSARNELDAMARGLAGGYVPAGPGNDPVRNPDSLPTGRNFYGFDPGRVPSEAAWLVGKKLADEFVANFRTKNNEWPSKLTFNLWAVETNRHDGAMEAQIMALMGIKPVWDGRGKVAGLEVIARDTLGRPRVDVTMIPTGLYRDLFAQTMQRLDEAVTLAQNQDESDNPMHKAVAELKKELVDSGIDATRADKLARVRMFTEPTGAYGTNLSNVVPASNTYGDRKDADDKASGVFFNRMRFAFGQGLWSDDMADRPGLGVDILKRSLKGTQAVVHSVSSNVYGALDNDDMFQYLGGTAMAARVVNGKTPEVYVADMATPNKAVTVTLERYIGREMRARYLNPKWIEAMMKEGYAGARLANQVVEYMWGWQVLTPEAIDDARWQEMYETWVADRNHLDIKEKFRAANNLLAYQALIDRMLVAINKGYWNASPETKAALEKANLEVIAEAGVACTRNNCSSPEIVALAEAQDKRAMESARAQPAPAVADIAENVARAVATKRAQPPASPSQSAATKEAKAESMPAGSAPASQEAKPQSAPPKSEGKTEKVDGYAMEEQSRGKSQAPDGHDEIIAAMIAAAALAGFASRFVPSR